MTTLITKSLNSKFNREETERALICVAFHNGNTQKASDQLKEEGMSISKDTLYAWTRKSQDHMKLYYELQEEILPKIRQMAAQGHMEAADRSMEVEAEVLARLREKIADLPARDLPGAVRNLGVTTAVHRDKARDLRGEASLVDVSHKRDLRSVLRALKSKGLDKAEEVVDAVVVEDEKPKAELEAA